MACGRTCHSPSPSICVYITTRRSNDPVTVSRFNFVSLLQYGEILTTHQVTKQCAHHRIRLVLRRCKDPPAQCKATIRRSRTDVTP